jgi:hypothetical protein
VKTNLSKPCAKRSMSDAMFFSTMEVAIDANQDETSRKTQFEGGGMEGPSPECSTDLYLASEMSDQILR